MTLHKCLIKLFPAKLVQCVFALGPAILLQFELGRTHRHTDARAVIPLAALRTFKPNMLSFALLLSHLLDSELATLPLMDRLHPVRPPTDTLRHLCPARPHRLKPFRKRLLYDLRYNAGADRSAPFTNSKTKTFLHRDWCNNLNYHRYVVPGHAHLCALALTAL